MMWHFKRLIEVWQFGHGVAWFTIGIICALALPVTWLLLPPPAFDDLHVVTGGLADSVKVYVATRGVPWARVPIRTREGFLQGKIKNYYYIWNRDSRPDLFKLKTGDYITVWIVPKRFKDGERINLWQVQYGDKILLTYEQALRAYREQWIRFAYWVAGMIFVGSALMLWGWARFRKSRSLIGA